MFYWFKAFWLFEVLSIGDKTPLIDPDTRLKTF